LLFLCRSLSMAERSLKTLDSEKETEKERSPSDGGIGVEDFGKVNSLRYNILILLANEKYDEAVETLRNFLDTPSEYPEFRARVKRFVNHSIELVHAIKAKKTFPGFKSLTRGKQQELREKFISHIRELVQVLKVVENIQIDLRVRDASSTKHVIRAIWAAFLCLAFAAFLVEVYDWLGAASYIVVDDFFGHVAEWILKKIGFLVIGCSDGRPLIPVVGDQRQEAFH